MRWVPPADRRARRPAPARCCRPTPGGCWSCPDAAVAQADRLARAIEPGVRRDDPRRGRALIDWTLARFARDGHTCCSGRPARRGLRPFGSTDPRRRRRCSRRSPVAGASGCPTRPGTIRTTARGSPARCLPRRRPPSPRGWPGWSARPRTLGRRPCRQAVGDRARRGAAGGGRTRRRARRQPAHRRAGHRQEPRPSRPSWSCCRQGRRRRSRWPPRPAGRPSGWRSSPATDATTVHRLLGARRRSGRDGSISTATRSTRSTPTWSSSTRRRCSTSSWPRRCSRPARRHPPAARRRPGAAALDRARPRARRPDRLRRACPVTELTHAVPAGRGRRDRPAGHRGPRPVTCRRSTPPTREVVVVPASGSARGRPPGRPAGHRLDPAGARHRRPTRSRWSPRCTAGRPARRR